MRLVHLYVALGGGAGAAARFWMSHLIPGGAGGAFPWATLLVNLAGSTLLGALLARSERTVQPAWFSPGLTIGFCGGFTTFSAFSYEAFATLADARYASAAWYVLGSTLVCIGGFTAGMWTLRSGSQ